MTRLSPARVGLSICLLAAAGLLAGAAPRAGSIASSPWFGRWTVSEERPVYTARGRQYKVIDIAPCGKDFCGVSVGDNGACGPGLFRFLAKHADGESLLHGKGLWGSARKNVQLSYYAEGDGDVDGPRSQRSIELYLGDGHDFGERSENMPRFHANYRRLGEARCKVP